MTDVKPVINPVLRPANHEKPKGLKGGAIGKTRKKKNKTKKE